MPENCIVIDKNTDLVYSPDDSGWYYQRFLGGKDFVSPIYKNRAEAVREWRDGAISWKRLR